MRPGVRTFCWAALGFFFFSAALVLADETTQNLQTVILESFDQPSTSYWILQGSKFITQGYPQMSFVKAWPDALFGRNKDNKDLYALGVHGAFDRKGYNYIEIIPAKKGDDGKLVPSPLAIPGRVQALDLWAWGANYDYYMDAHLRDYEGVDHTLRMGDLNYAGWRDLTVQIPASIPQSRRYIPRYQQLELTEFVLWTRPEEKVDGFYLFLDQIKVLSDMFESRFDGDNLADQDTLDQLWTAGGQAGK